MTLLSLANLLEEYTAAQNYSLALVEGLDADQLVWRPDENASAISWHLGHQAVVNHFMVRNLTAAEVTFNADFDAVFDSATPEPGRGELPPLGEIVSYRSSIAATTHRVVNRIAEGDVGAPAQLTAIAVGMVHAIVNHEYQHAKWVGEVAVSLLAETEVAETEVAETGPGHVAPAPTSSNLILVDGYYMLA